jgi:hypothetical protein
MGPWAQGVRQRSSWLMRTFIHIEINLIANEI